MPLLWCRFDCDWQEDPFVAPLAAEERHVVGTVYVIAARRGEPTWRPPDASKGETEQQPQHMRVGVDWLEPSYVAKRAGCRDVETARRVLDLMRQSNRITIEPGLDTALVRNVAAFNAEPIRDAKRKRDNRRRPTPHPQDGDRATPERLETPAGQPGTVPDPGDVEGRKEGRKEVITTEGDAREERVGPGAALSVVPLRNPNEGALAAVALAYEVSGLFPAKDGNPDFFNCGLFRTWTEEWLDAGRPAAHIGAAIAAVAVAWRESGGKEPQRPIYAIRTLVNSTPVGAPMAWGLETRTAGDGTSGRRSRPGTHDAASLRAQAAALEAEGK